MAKLYYRYASMNSGKSTDLLTTAYNYKEMGHSVRYFTSSLDDRYSVGKITSRIGIEAESNIIKPNSLQSLNECYDEIESKIQQEIDDEIEIKTIFAVLVDESQFLSSEQVDKLTEFVDNLGVVVFCYGIRTDFQGNLFEGSRRLFEVADTITELKNMCSCGSKATMNARLVDNTDKVFIGGNESYKSMCRKCHKQHMRSK
jgi:thymidine kinase